MVEKVQKMVVGASEEKKMLQVNFLPLIQVNLLVDVASWSRVHFEIGPFLWNKILDLGWVLVVKVYKGS